MGFKIICNKCKNEIDIQNNFENTMNNIIDIYATREERIIIECTKCGNEIISE